MKNLKFSYDVSTIGGYSDQVGGLLLSKALIGGTTAANTNVRTGIKGTQALNLLDSTPVFQDGACSLQPSGVTQFTQHNITTATKTLFEDLCPQTLFDTYQSMLMKAGQTQEEVPFEAMILDLKKKQIEQYVENLVWTATTAGGEAFNGFSFLISKNTGNTFASAIASSSGTSFTTAAYGTSGNPITEIDNMINSLDDNALSREDLVCFMNYSNFRKYVQALTKANFFTNYINSTDITSNMSAVHPNTNVKIIPTIGLNGSNQIVLGPSEYMLFGVDQMSDESLRAWYSIDFQSVRFRSIFNVGVTIATFGTTKYFVTNGLS